MQPSDEAFTPSPPARRRTTEPIDTAMLRVPPSHPLGWGNAAPVGRLHRGFAQDAGGDVLGLLNGLLTGTGPVPPVASLQIGSTVSQGQRSCVSQDERRAG
jgi:hypothetical protein